MAWQRAWATIPGDWADFDVTIDGLSLGDSGFGLVYNGDLATGSAYAVIIHPNQFQGVYLKQIFAATSDVEIDSTPLPAKEPGTPLVLRVVRQSSQVSVYLNGVLQFTADDGAPAAHGSLGLIESTTNDTAGAGANFTLLRVPTASGLTTTSSTGGSSSSGSSGSKSSTRSSTSTGGSSSSRSSSSSSGGSTGSTGLDGGAIGPHGGSVDLLHFGITGDTRPETSNSQGVADYPTVVIDQIAKDFAAAKVQFVADLGDHMNNWENATTAEEQMTKYQAAMADYPGQWFLAMGNHECDNSAEVCVPGGSGGDAGNFTTFLSAVEKTGVGDLPYYSFDIQTSLGLATFVVIADNAWSDAQQTWLENTLTTADANAKYTLILRHHPPDDTSNGDATSLTAISPSSAPTSSPCGSRGTPTSTNTPPKTTTATWSRASLARLSNQARTTSAT